MPCFLGEPKQRNAEEQSGNYKENGRTIGITQTKELTCEKYRKQERRAMPLASANMMPSLSKRARRVSGPSAMLLPTAALS